MLGWSEDNCDCAKYCTGHTYNLLCIFTRIYGQNFETRSRYLCAGQVQQLLSLAMIADSLVFLAGFLWLRKTTSKKLYKFLHPSV